MQSRLEKVSLARILTVKELQQLCKGNNKGNENISNFRMRMSVLAQLQTHLQDKVLIYKLLGHIGIEVWRLDKA